MHLTTSSRFMALGAVFVFLAAGCSSTRTQKSAGESIDDTVIATRIKADLIGDPLTKAGDIDVEVFKGRVQLNGFVGSGTEKNRATAVARQVNGVTAVDNNLKMKGAERTVSDTIDDGALSIEVKAALAGDARTKTFQIDVNTRNAVVLLAGFVDNATARTAAGELASGVKGVARVDNQIAIK